MNKGTNKITFTWGLPGSGKTTFCQKALEISKTRRGQTHIFSHDDPSYKNNNQRFVNQINDYLQCSIEHLLIDTLITTNEGFSNFLKQLELSKLQELEIQYWIPNIENCLWNDRFRRNITSEITIKNTVIEKPDIKKILKLCPHLENIKFTIVMNTVIKKEDWKMFADKYNIRHKDGIVKSDTWSLGGTSGNCWDSHLTTISGSAPLTSFKEFDDLMMEVCPTLNFLQYKKLYNDCVTSDTYSEGDYYGGGIDYAFYQYNVENLYSGLKSMNLIPTE